MTRTYQAHCSNPDGEHEFTYEAPMDHDEAPPCPECQDGDTVRMVFLSTGGFRIKGKGVFNPGSHF